jgi:competence protein ComEA
MQLSRRQIIAYLAVGAVVAAVGVRYVVAPRVASPGGGQPLVLTSVVPSPAAPDAAGAPAAQAPGAATAGPETSEAVVYVCGAVRSPGVLRLPQGSRVADALELAGGATSRAELAAVNLAARVADGQQILVPEKAQAAPAAAGSGAASSASGVASAAGLAAAPVAAGAPVNINTATLEQLDALQGVGPATAQKIIDYRTANGPFATIEDIKNVAGIGDAKFAAMKDSITV